MRLNKASVIAGCLVLSLTGCGRKAAPSSETAFRPSATLQEIMVSVIDPNVDPIWESIATIVTAEGTQEIRPNTDEDWAKLKQHAITLREASNLLLIEGRKVAADNANTSSAPAELSALEIAQLIASNRQDFIKNAHFLHDTVTRAIKDIEARDVEALEITGGIIDQACEQCHMQFWYPGDKRPTH